MGTVPLFPERPSKEPKRSRPGKALESAVIKKTASKRKQVEKDRPEPFEDDSQSECGDEEMERNTDVASANQMVYTTTQHLQEQMLHSGRMNSDVATKPSMDWADEENDYSEYEEVEEDESRDEPMKDADGYADAEQGKGKGRDEEGWTTAGKHRRERAAKAPVENVARRTRHCVTISLETVPKSVGRSNAEVGSWIRRTFGRFGSVVRVERIALEEGNSSRSAIVVEFPDAVSVRLACAAKDRRRSLLCVYAHLPRPGLRAAW